MTEGRSIFSSRSSGGVIRWLRPQRGTSAAVRVGHGRVYLRRPRDADWKDWSSLRAASRAFLTPWEPTWPNDALTRAAFRRRLRQYTQDWREGSAYNFLIFRGHGDALLGGINLSNVRRGIVQGGSLGYWIGGPYARQGYMSEAMQCMLSFAFEHLDLHRVEAACLPDNAASRALLRKSGFRQEGRARKYLRINGVWQDHLTFAILREEWEAARPPPAAT
jgi:ribosomal-protein-alanine N-acetyltransferase